MDHLVFLGSANYTTGSGLKLLLYLTLNESENEYFNLAGTDLRL